MEKYYEFVIYLYFVFINYKQAYKDIDRGELWKGLKIIGVREDNLQNTIFAE